MSNLWAKFAELLPGDPTLIGKVSSHTADGYSILEMPGGGVMKAKGISVTTGKKVFVQGGEVRGEAPELEYFEVDV